MPIYLYQHPDSGETIEVFQGMNDTHEHIDGEDVKWNRVFTSPNAFVDLEADPFSNTQFIERTSNSATVGELWDRSADMSSKRADANDGVDPLKKDYYKKYSDNRGGAKHLSDPD